MEMTACVILGYLSGSVLYARIFARIFHREKALECSKDGNPGTANAFLYGGFWCGTLTLICDLGKGFLPVFLFARHGIWSAGGAFSHTLISGLALAAPVIGHAFPLFYGFQGGKGIATTFGCLLGLAPMWQPFGALAAFFLLFSIVLRITPHYHRTLFAYVCCLLVILCTAQNAAVKTGFLMIASTVCIRLFASREQREKVGVKLLWMH